MGRSLAIIGAGMSGLFAARLAVQRGLDVTVFEQGARWGGNAWTRRVEIPGPAGTSTRWCDMGVNDYNEATYEKVSALIRELEVPVGYLENSCCFSTADGSLRYTLDVIDGEVVTTMPDGLRRDFEHFKTNAPKHAKLMRYKEMSIEKYLHDAEAGYKDPDSLAKLVIYPRVNAMYFNADLGPRQMPFVSIMSYYGLQEGFGDGKASETTRRYFKNGSSDFVLHMKAWLEARGVQFVSVFPGQCRVDADDLGVDVLDCDRPPGTGVRSLGRFDDAILAVPAYDALRAIRSGSIGKHAEVLSDIDYFSSVGWVHTFAGVMPPDRNAWRTYNVLIHGDRHALQPYSISYVINLHQNDPADPALNKMTTPTYFYTLNPHVPIPDEYVLRVPAADLTPEDLDNRATAFFPHNGGSFRTLRAQAKLWEPSGAEGPGLQGYNHLYFTGGWTHRAGLMEECHRSAEAVIARLMTPDVEVRGILMPGEEY